MKISFRMICLLAVTLSALVGHASAAEKGSVNLVKPIVPSTPVDTIEDEEEFLACAKGFVMQQNEQCCPAGTDNKLWEGVCTPTGTVEGQLFNYNATPHYCPGADMFIVSDKNLNWFSCADGDSTAMYTAATGFDGCKFCGEHGYGCLIRIAPWGTVGCVKVGDSQGDGCIEANTCSFAARN